MLSWHCQILEQPIPTGVDRVEVDKNASASIDQMDNISVDLDVAVIDSGLVSVLPGARPAVVEQLDSGVLVANLHGVVVDANPAVKRLLGGSHPVGQPLDSLLDRTRSDTSRTIEVMSWTFHSVQSAS